MTATLIWPSACHLGEGPLFAHGRFWAFDILAGRLLSCLPGGEDKRDWQMGEPASAAVATTDGGFIVATATALRRFHPDTGLGDVVVPLDTDTDLTRSNDGRADRQGGFWISTMGRAAQAGAGAIYRWYKGELRCLRSQITIPNAICFAPDGSCAYFTDTAKGHLMRWTLDAEGWPLGEPVSILDASGKTYGLDGAVTDSEGHLWIALWEGHRLIRVSPEGQLTDERPLPVSRPTCPAWGPDLKTLFVTSARQGMSEAEISAEPQAGHIYTVQVDIPGMPEPMLDA